RAVRRVDRGGAQARPGLAREDGRELPHVRHPARPAGADARVMDAGACGIVLAGGAGRRFGSAKQLADLRGRPLVQWALDAALAAQGLDRVVLVLGAQADAVRDRIDPGRAEIVDCSEWEEGMAGSLRCGVAAAGGAAWYVVLLGDQPLRGSLAVDAIVSAARSAPPEVLAVRGRWDGRPGHPVALRAGLTPRLLALRGDAGAR